MVLDGLRGYLQLANGLTDVTRERARSAAKSLVAQGEAGVGAMLPDSLKTQVGSLTDDLIATSKANRALLVGLVGTEVEKATARLGLTYSSELESAKRRAQRLETRVADLERELHAARSSAAKRGAAKRSTTKESPANKTTARKSTAKSSAAKKSATTKTAATKTAATKTAATKTAAKKTAAKTTP